MPEAANAARPGGAGDPLRLSRRRIYFNRLIGDNVLSSRMTHRRRDSLGVVFRFLIYAGLAAMVIAGRSEIGMQNKVNTAIVTALKRRPYKTGPPASYFDDIFSVGDVAEWIKYSVLPQLFLEKPFSEQYSFFSFNRLLQIYSSSSANIRLTMRKMDTVDSVETTTSRFNTLYPKTWKNFRQGPDAAASDDHVDPIYGTYTFDEAVDDIKYPYIGTNEYDEPIQKWNDLEKDDPVKVTWKYSANAGYHDKGGYVALIDLKVNDGHRDILKKLNDKNEVNLAEIATNIVGDQLVQLLEFGEQEKVPTDPVELADKRLETPAPPPATGLMRLDNFFESGLIDSTTSNIMLEFQTYNPNYQTLSYVQATFSWNAAGALDEKNIQVDTVKIEYPPGTYLHILEYLYAASTAYYALQQIISLYKLRTAFFFDAWSWIDLLSTIFSSLSMWFWSDYEEVGATMYGMYNDFPTLEFLQKRIGDFQTYARISSCATLSIFIRINKFLAGSQTRVKLLQHTMALSAFQMFVYIMFICVVFFGFVAVANTNFAPHSENFASIGYTMLTCFGMFLGDIEPMAEVQNASLNMVYFIPFMLFFYFICVQMFNAIINYSYNKASEDMEPIFEKERQEKKRRDKSKKQSPGMFAVLKAWWKKHRKKKNKTETAATDQMKEDPSKDSKGKTAGSGKDMSLDSLDPVVKEQVEAYLLKDKDHAAGDSFAYVMLFFVFSASYIYFLYDNLWVPKNFQMNFSVRDAITRASSARMNSDGDYLYASYNEVASIHDLNIWITEVLPIVIYEGSTAPTQYNSFFKPGETIIPADQYCINGWNCLLQGDLSSPMPSMVRITQRKVDQLNNNEPSVMNGKAVMEKRRHADGIDSRGERDKELAIEKVEGNEPQQFQLPAGSFCHWKKEGEGGYMNLGGLECLMAAKKQTHLEQLELFKADFVSIETGSVVIEFVGYNGNTDMLIYSSWHFKIGSHGMVEKSPENLAFVFKDYTDISAIAGLGPGLIYAALVAYYAYKEIVDIRKEAIRKKSREEKNFGTALIEHFTQDFFSILNWSSILLSLFSIILFINYFQTTLQFTEKLRLSFADFVTFIAVLGESNKLYVRLSSMNVLVIFLRVLKFFRENPRMNKLNQTLWLAKTDIAWFVVMLFIIMFGFVMFAYVSFGGKIEGLANLGAAVQYCFEFQLGNFNFWELYKVDQVMAVVFFFPYLILFYCVFMNIFFAIIDRFFVTATPPPVNIKRRLKPFFGRICRCIQWDEDFVMEDDPNQEKKTGPPSRKERVQETAMKIEDMRTKAAGLGADQIAPKRSRTLNEVCEMDERMTEVIHWGRDEAKKFIEKYQRLLQKKQESSAKEERFIQTEVMGSVLHELEQEEKNMEAAKRAVRYALLVHEKMTAQDQEMLARYILLLEYKIQKKMVEEHALQAEVSHLRLEAELMRFTEDQLKENEEGGGGGGAARMIERGAERKKARAADEAGEEAALEQPAHDAGEAADGEEHEEGEDQGKSGGARTNNMNDPERLMEEDGPEHKADMKKALANKLKDNMDK